MPYPTRIQDTSGRFRRLVQKRQRVYSRRKVSSGAGPVVNVTRGRGRFPTMYNMPMPQAMVTTLRYTDPVTINPAIGAAGGWAFSANGLFDPNITGTGHQPMGFDQLMAFYNHYEVIGARIKMTAVPASEVTGFNFGVKLDDNSAFTTIAYESACEHSMTAWKTHPGVNLSNGFDVYNSFSSKKFFGERSGDRETWGNAASNPNEQAYFICFISPLTNLQDIGPIPCMVAIEYIVKFHEARDLSAS